MFRQHVFKKQQFLVPIYVSARTMKPVVPADPTVPWGYEIRIIWLMMHQKQQQHFAVLTRPGQEQQEKEMALKKKLAKCL